ncbi:ATP-binding protein [Vibrio renipiscarius]|uniref:Anti-sigma F factor antagonist n=1 Tax=Vibrio renipiscarius TaxID=1461322 RepID=A0A0C2JIJ1_9VIBR|nr:ATP-binding protein [Vibrio renipiscarius]KII76645.1 anti-sigma F factor antagonist [Vibrio renipiscarius]KII77834.1 anti-sigma F factor antagonist [Vibrio renipiscarius]
MSHNQCRHFNHTYLSSLEASRLASEDLQNFCTSAGIANEFAAQLELCVVEMVNNAFIHAYQEKEGLPIALQLEIEGDARYSTLKLSVSDYGSVMSQQELKKKLDKQFIEPDPEDDSTWLTSGRGFIIVSSLMDSVSLSSENTKNTFLMVKAIEEQFLNA